MTSPTFPLPRPWGTASPQGIALPVAIGTGAALVAAVAAVLLGPTALGIPLAGAAAYALVRHPLVLYVAFLYIGLYKGQAVLDALPDATVALALLLGGVCFHRLLTGRVRTVPPLLWGTLLVIAVMLAVSLNWTAIPDYGTEKTLKFATFCVLAALAPFCLIESWRDLERLLAVFVVGAIVSAVIVLALGSTVGSGRLEFGGEGNTLYTSRFLLIGAAILVLASALRLWRHRLLLPLAAVVLIGVAVGIGSRGPLVAFAFAMVSTVIAVVLRQPRRLLPVLLVVGFGVALLSFISLPETSAERLAGVASDPAGTLQGNLRSKLYAQAIEATEEHPLVGIGAGGFFQYGYLITHLEERYPHNIFLETSSELGIPAALLLAICVLAMLAGLFRRAWAAVDDRDGALIHVIAAVFLIELFAAQFSGDFNDNRGVWALLGVGWLVVRHGPSLQDRAAGDQ
jgi:O-antigen ligase